jgi:hypothetical protein
MRRAHGIDVSDVLISRGPQASQQARAIGALAFTRNGEVVLPPEAGPIERPQTRALLAHELTHAAQQRALGPNLPAADSPAGFALERQARAVEQMVLGPPLGARIESTAAFSPPPDPIPSSPAQVQRQIEELPPSLPTGNAFDPFALLPQQPVADAPAVEQPQPPPGEASQDTGSGPASTRLLELAGRRLLDLDDSLAVGTLADSIYKRVRSRLRHELLIDRERSGLLSDFR